MSQSPLRYTLDEVATLFGKAPAYFLRARHKIERAGFPAPLPGFMPFMWSRAAVDAWFESDAGRRPIPDRRPGGQAIDKATAELDARYGADRAR